MPPDAPLQKSDKIALLEEVAHVDVQSVATGRVRISTHVSAVEEIARADLETDTVEVTRVPVNQPVTGALPEVRTKGDLTIVPVFEEVPVVEKRLMLKEELHIRRIVTSEAVAMPVTLRQQTAAVERLDAKEQTP